MKASTGVLVEASIEAMETSIFHEASMITRTGVARLLSLAEERFPGSSGETVGEPFSHCVTL